MKTVIFLFSFLFLILIVVFLSYREEFKLNDKFSEGFKYDVEVFYVKSIIFGPRIELRDKKGILLIEPKKIKRSYKAKDCEFFFYYKEKNKALEIYVDTGIPEWHWSKRDKENWKIVQ